ncbi:DUF833-domain-containing protein [Epithele typhae]|uniref:DUF833-domain-containing protein n=1 Tax=Epithele typhae TaxID=378194 RepID=UPI0020075004|nr:DUF833-domain-containing protein [Epithele typhae]KAH9924345.1 DUF833-domain-containing protein [Epithele typhae]
MCVGFWTVDHPDYALILCSNRDEFLSRPTAPAQWHSFGPIGTDVHGDAPADPGAPTVLSGRDLAAGGTWLGINRTGRIAVLTNITEPYRKYASSRGDLTSSFLLPQTPGVPLSEEIDAFLAANRGRAYAGFNMLLLSPSTTPPARPGTLDLDAALLTNSGGGGALTARPLTDDERSCGGLSNGLIDRAPGEPEWPKVQHGRVAFREMLASLAEDTAEAEVVERLFALLTWQTAPAPAARRDLSTTVHVAPIRVPPVAPPHRTRLSTAILVRHDGRATFVERDVWTLPGGEDAREPVRAPLGHDRVFRFAVGSTGALSV